MIRTLFLQDVIFVLAIGLTTLGETGAGPADRSGQVEVRQKINVLHEKIQRLDKTVWAQEELAQRYEQTFVRLWDDLLRQSDKFSVLANFVFDELVFGELTDDEPLDWGIRRKSYRGGAKHLNHAQWQDLVKAFSRDYRIHQTEWHHASFHIGEDGNAFSTVAMVIHASDKAQSKRYILKGDLKVRWRGTPAAGGPFVPAQIDAGELTVLEREGQPVFASHELEGAIRQHGKDIGPLLVYDLDGDGLSEILLPELNALYCNENNFEFAKETLLTHPPKYTVAGVVADFTSDGIVDLVLAVGGTDPAVGLALYRGDELGRFSTPPEFILTRDLTLPLNITAGDVNGDGHLDLYVTQYRHPYLNGVMPTPYYDANDGFPAHLLTGDGQGNFENITEQTGLTQYRNRRTYSSSFFDLDEDGDLDLLVVSDFAGIDIYTNDGTGHFALVTDRIVDIKDTFGMSHSFGDYDLDGRLDFYVVGMSSTTARRLDEMGLGRAEFATHQAMRRHMGYGNRMYLAGPNRYVLPDFNRQVARTGWSWGATSFDMDNDGDLDIYIANGHNSGRSVRDYCTRFWCHDIYLGSSKPDPVLFQYHIPIMSRVGQDVSWNGYEHNHLFMNLDGRGFVNVAFLLGVAFEYDSRMVVSDDLNADGRSDLLVMKYYSSDQGKSLALQLVENHWPEKQNWIGIRFPDLPGASPIGARITLTCSGKQQIASVVNGDSFRSQHATARHFGLGQAKKIDRLEVRWLDGRIRRLDNPAINRYHAIRP